MRKGGPSEVKEAIFRAVAKGKEVEEQEGSGYVSKKDEINFVKKLQLGTGRFRGKIPFKCFSCGRVGHYVAKCPHKDNHEKGKELAKGNRRWFVNRKSYYTHEDSDGLSNSEEGESDQDIRLLMAFEKDSSEAKDNFMDALEGNDFLEEINQVKICLEENKISIDTLKNQLIEKEKHNEKLECEIVSLRHQNYIKDPTKWIYIWPKYPTK